MPHFTAEHITRTIFDETIPPNAFDKAVSAVFGRETTAHPIPLKSALKRLQSQGMAPAALQKVEKTLNNLMVDRLHDFLINHTLRTTKFDDNATMSVLVIHNIRWSNNYYLGASVVSPRIDLTTMPRIIQDLRDEFKEDMHQTITLAHFQFKKPTASPTPSIHA